MRRDCKIYVADNDSRFCADAICKGILSNSVRDKRQKRDFF